MPGLIRMRLRASVWRAIEAARESLAARFSLGCLDLLAGLLLYARGRLFESLDRLSRIRRVLGVPLLEGAADLLERRIHTGVCLDARGRPLPIGENRLVDDFRRSATCRSLFRGGIQSWDRLVNMGHELIILKEPDLATGELGVILLKYTPAFARFVAIYDVARVMERYQIVLEPSWIGYHDPVFRLFYARERHVVVEAQFEPDFDLIAQAGANLVPVPFCAGHWVDRGHFHPLPGVHKDYLAVFVANWAPHKRHELALDALARIEDPDARLALVGYPWKGYTRERLQGEVRRRGLARRVDFYERINRKEVNQIFNRSHSNLILSRKEGSVKVFYESLAAGTPCIVIDDHEGVQRSAVNDRTGLYAPARDLHAAMLMMRDEGPHFDPRGWWEENASVESSTEKLEHVLCARAVQEGRPWVRGLYRKTNDPNLRYCDESLYERLRPAYAELARLLRPDEELRRLDLQYERPEA